MAISLDDVLHVGGLSKIRPTQEEAARLQTQFADILNYMERLNAVDTSGVAPLYSPHEGVPAVREDQVVKTCERSELLKNSPADSDEFFVVPRVI
ncbi:MAG: Asp-tRNA(Asn)/Glu-tRNA(Gln) amidotransferase subunit GatC [Desulfovibrionaceae bacterium]|nr:Asp-tRNA(Asn)/Glu-tRNA(Gln) amidotransferase subunit GatC [Desulfovibrionaceae bacterium]